MKTTEFLKLIGAPWSAYHDHPSPDTAASRASIRPTDAAADDEICGIYLCDYPGRTGESQRARRDLIKHAPDLYLFAVGMAASGDTQARMLLQKIHGDQQ